MMMTSSLTSLRKRLDYRNDGNEHTLKHGSFINNPARGPRQNLPSTAIYCQTGPRNHYDCFNAFYLSPFEGVPASLGLRLKSVSGAVRSLGAKLSSRASSMPALAPRVKWLMANAGTHQAEATDRSAWDWYAGSCSCGLQVAAALRQR